MFAGFKNIFSTPRTKAEKARTVIRTTNTIAGVAPTAVEAILTAVTATSTIVGAAYNAFGATSPAFRAGVTPVRDIPAPFKAASTTVERFHPAVGTTVTPVEGILLQSERCRLQSKGFSL